MQRKTKIVLIVVAAAAVVSLLAISVASSLEMFFFTQNLVVSDFKQIGDDSYSVNVTDGGVRTANIYIRAEHRLPQSVFIPVLVSIWHSQDTELDSLLLKFTGTHFIDAFIEAPGGSPWKGFHFENTPDAKGTYFQIGDLGFQGTGTVTLRFLLTDYYDATSFHFEAQFTMHKYAILQLTKQEAQTQSDIPILA